MTTNLKHAGIVPDLSNTLYHAHDAVSASGLVRFLKKTPAHYKAYVEGERTQTKAMSLGTAIHCAILEPQLFAKTYVAKPEGMSFATNDGKAWKSAHAGKEFLSQDEWQAIYKIVTTIKSREDISKYFVGGQAEQSFFWVDEETGLECKCRPDYFDGNVVVDIKTAEDADARSFQRSVGQYFYHIQSAFYLDGISKVTGRKITDFVHVVIEKEAPYGIATYILDDASLEKAREQIKNAMKMLSYCKEADLWPSYPQQLQTMNLPTWLWETE